MGGPGGTSSKLNLGDLPSPPIHDAAVDALDVEGRCPFLIAGPLQYGCSAYFGWLFAYNLHYLSRHRSPEYDAHIQLSAQSRTQTPNGGPLIQSS